MKGQCETHSRTWHHWHNCNYGGQLQTIPCTNANATKKIMHDITEQYLSNDKTKDIQYTVFVEMSVVAQLNKFPLIYGNQVTLQCPKKHFIHLLSSHEQLQSNLTYFFNTCITVRRLCLFFDNNWYNPVTIFSVFLFVLWSTLDAKLRVCREHTFHLVCYIFKIWLGHFVTKLGKMS